MSLRPKQASQNTSESAAAVLATIHHAQAAQAAWVATHSVAEVDAASSLRETIGEAWDPWELKFEQTITRAGVYGGWKAKHQITLTKGTHSRLHAMVESITPALEPAYENGGWSTVQPGNVYKVCTKPEDSYGAWAFTKLLQGEDLNMADAGTKTWFIPGSAENPERALRTIFNVPFANKDLMVDINDVSYIISEKYPEVLGELAVFSIGRASYFRDKVSR